MQMLCGLSLWASYLQNTSFRLYIPQAKLERLAYDSADVPFAANRREKKMLIYVELPKRI
jgi:hypothetical protein